MERELRPNWDAANPESYKLAKRLGFTFIETYDSYYHTREYNLPQLRLLYGQGNNGTVLSLRAGSKTLKVLPIQPGA